MSRPSTRSIPAPGPRSSGPRSPGPRLADSDDLTIRAWTPRLERRGRRAVPREPVGNAPASARHSRSSAEAELDDLIEAAASPEARRAAREAYNQPVRVRLLAPGGQQIDEGWAEVCDLSAYGVRLRGLKLCRGTIPDSEHRLAMALVLDEGALALEVTTNSRWTSEPTAERGLEFDTVAVRHVPDPQVPDSQIPGPEGPVPSPAAGPICTPADRLGDLLDD